MYPYYREYQMLHERYPLGSKIYGVKAVVESQTVVDVQKTGILSEESDIREYNFLLRSAGRFFKLFQFIKGILDRFFQRREDDIDCYLRLEFQKSKFQNYGKYNQY